MRIKAIIFDLDGTLLNTLSDIAGAANHALEKGGFPNHPEEAYRYFVGNGSNMLMTRALPAAYRNQDTILRSVDRFLKAYGKNWHHHTRPYDGIMELLDELTRRNIAMAVLTNKRHFFAQQCMAYFFKRWPFNPVLGQQGDTPPKPDPAMALQIARTLALAPKEILFLGDSATDIETATAAGMIPMGAGWGFRTVAELEQSGARKVLSHPLDALKALFSNDPGNTPA
jgi:phosphoglycolate phosphatase